MKKPEDGTPVVVSEYFDPKSSKYYQVAQNGIYYRESDTRNFDGKPWIRFEDECYEEELN
jgi:hypothetical protein